MKVYWNSHKKVFSVKNGNNPVEHHNQIWLQGCLFKVSKAGRERVLREKRKNVHAYITGNLFLGAIDQGSIDNGRIVTYNPYRDETFIMLPERKKIEKAVLVYCSVTDEKKPNILAFGVDTE